MKTRTTGSLAASLLSAVFMLAVACGNGGGPGTPGTGGSAAGTSGSAGTGGSAGTTGAAGTSDLAGTTGTGGGTGGTGGAGCSCDPRTQYCYLIVGGAIGNPGQYSCRTLPAACGTMPTCACVQGQGCGNLCSAGDAGIMVTCQAP